jgi:hypothetical protein
VAGLHTQFGADASREVVVSWHSTASVSRPRVLLGNASDGFGHTEAAETSTYRDAKSGTVVQVHHARLTSLRPDTDYVYAAVHDGAAPELGTVRTAPRGRGSFTFTSFGDQGTPTLGKLAGTAYLNDNLGSPFGGDVTAGVERVAPLFHLVNGDLCYANLATDRIRTWSDWFENNSRSARFRPWMPAAGNHRRLGADRQPQQRRRVLPGRRQLLHPRLLRGRPTALAGRRTRGVAGQSCHRLDRGVHAPGCGVHRG